ncbi:cadherin-related family member 2 [Phascolarctos cinereus]|uniref:Cadherin-related family member 2 n=1 Tax=Phascolarctos cinereus TaxID=38626 RepID=A0A6P5LF43_PHACI|nr:cadherin-related family member 2 [Phascolarctos cinereus]XP_020854165.1 cadherin-related family member 2 [Phascolarctos cinereus]XP_020854166.1 cadherin-related family member 2 [Phascolarctos cinereus]
MAWSLLVLLPCLLVSVHGNSAPRFTSNMTVVRLPEDMPTGTVAFWITATDQDGDPLVYQMSGRYSYFFEVNENTGETTLSSPLDYETLFLFDVTISVWDNVNPEVQKQLQIIVLDTNDNEPVFMDTPYSTSINETLPVGSQVYTVRAEDPDTGLGGVVNYTILEVIPNTAENQKLFSILPNGTIILEGPLSYNNKSVFYQLKLQSCDQDLDKPLCSQPAFLTITVIDLPDLDPEFLQEPYTASVEEDAAMGTTVLTLKAMDGDKGINDLVKFSISNSTRPWFSIGEEDGVVEVSHPLDRELLLDEDEEVHLEVTATEIHLNIYGQEAKARTWVTIRVTDVNDHCPQFYHCILPDCDFSDDKVVSTFSGYVAEHSSTRLPISNLSMVGYDPDKNLNGTFLLSLSGPDHMAFTVSPEKVVNTGEVQVLVWQPNLVDFELQQTMEVEVIAQDSGNHMVSTATVIIHVEDINDHAPQFNESQYILYVYEHCPDGTVVTNDIKATDPDTDFRGHITYQLISGNSADIFQVNSSSGEITVKNGTLLDRELQSVYYLTLLATDGGGLTGSTLLQVILLDINDNAPVVTGSYNIFVKEMTDDVSVTIQAYDNDEPGTDNSEIRFKLLPGPYSDNFTVDSVSGLLKNQGPLDREAIDPNLAGRIVLTVLVYDLGVPSLNTTVNVTIYVEDINDNMPVFVQNTYEFYVKERVKGAYLGFVEAWDADQTDVNNRVTFTLTGDGTSNFEIRSTFQGSGWNRGNVSLVPDVSLDYETPPSNFTLLILAQNAVESEGIASATVLVITEDVNDEAPSILASSLEEVKVFEHQGKKDEFVTRVVAQDPDTDALLEIRLQDIGCFKRGVNMGTVCQDWFRLVPNGSVYINDSLAIDYEVCDLVRLFVQALDLHTAEGFPANSPNETLPIAILDVNDHPPQFLPLDETFVIVPEILSPNQQVAFVKATDEDDGVNAALSFFIDLVEFISKDGSRTPSEGLFRIKSSSEGDIYTGSIEVVTSLDSSLQGTYQLTIRAQDNSSENTRLTANTSLNLFTVDQSHRLRLQFSTGAAEVGSNTNIIRAALTEATRTTVHIVSIKDIEVSISRAKGLSYMDAYFVYSNGTALNLNELNLFIRGDQDALEILLRLGLVVIGSGEEVKQDKETELLGIIAGLGCALTVLIIIMTISLVCTRKSYKRKLRAVKAAKEAKKTSHGFNLQGPVIPGTNLFNSEKANPMLNLSSMDLGFESLSSHNEDDVASINSLDENKVDTDMDMMIDIDLGKKHKEKPELTAAELLTMVLKEGKGKNQERDKMVLKLGEFNMALDTTDL